MPESPRLQSLLDLQDKIVLVVGGSGGIGSAVVNRFVDGGQETA